MSAYGGDGPLLMGITWTGFSLSVVTLILRYYTNKVVLREFGWDFWWFCVTLFFGLVALGVLTAACAYGLGRNNADLDEWHSSRAIMTLWIGQALCIFAIALSKLVVIAFLLRVQGNSYRWGTYFLYFLAATNLIINTFETILVQFQCDPTWKLWMPEVPGNCYVRDHVNNVSGYLQGAWNAGSDVALAIYPAVIFYNMQMPRRLKVGVSALMATGLLTAACAAAKTWEIRQTHIVNDATQAMTSLTLLNWSELWITLIAASIPAVWPLITFWTHGGCDPYMRQHNPSTLDRSRPSVGGRRGSGNGIDDNHGGFDPNGVPMIDSAYGTAQASKTENSRWSRIDNPDDLLPEDLIFAGARRASSDGFIEPIEDPDEVTDVWRGVSPKRMRASVQEPV